MPSFCGRVSLDLPLLASWLESSAMSKRTAEEAVARAEALLENDDDEGALAAAEDVLSEFDLKSRKHLKRRGACCVPFFRSDMRAQLHQGHQGGEHITCTCCFLGQGASSRTLNQSRALGRFWGQGATSRTLSKTYGIKKCKQTA